VLVSDNLISVEASFIFISQETCSLTSWFPGTHLYGSVFITRSLAMGLHVTCSHLKAVRPEYLTGVPPFLLPRAELGFIFSWLGFSCGDFSPTAPAAPSLRCQSVQVYNHHPFFLSKRWGKNYPEWPVLPHFRLLLRMRSLFPFRRGRPLHNVQSPILRNPTEDPTIRFLILRCSGFIKPWILTPFLHSGFG
jgi:hypothetical protein